MIPPKQEQSIASQSLATSRERAKTTWQLKQEADLYLTVGMGTCGLAAGAADTLAAIEAELKQRNLPAMVGQVGCVGMCACARSQ